jgi:hypothetical protein
MIAAVQKMRWTILASLALGVLAGALVPQDVFTRLRDWIDPVVTATVKLDSRQGESFVVSITWEKNRDCFFKGLSAYGHVGHYMVPTSMTRIDAPAANATHPAGWVGTSVWRVGPPLAGATHVSLWARYDCDGKLKFPQIAEVDL